MKRFNAKATSVLSTICEVAAYLVNSPGFECTAGLGGLHNRQNCLEVQGSQSYEYE